MLVQITPQQPLAGRLEQSGFFLVLLFICVTPDRKATRCKDLQKKAQAKS